LMLSLAASNIAGFTKKSTVMAMIFLGYCAGNLSGPQFFISTEAPDYHVCILPTPCQKQQAKCATISYLFRLPTLRF
jgi:hypothetical protein